jgi:hypothetical protein
MTSLVLPDELNPEFEHDQLVLDPEAFEIIRGLADAGVVTPVSLKLTPDLPVEHAMLIATYFGEMSRDLQWWVGDLLIQSEENYGEEFAQIAAATGLSEGALLRRMFVCRNVAEARRRPGLPFSVHMAVATLNAKDQERWLKKAEKGQWSAQELRSRMKAARKDEAPPLLPDDEPGDVDEKLLIDATRNLVAHAELAGENVICRREDFARVKAALGEEE